MRARDLEQLYDYGYWANQRLFAVLTTLTPDEFTRPVAGNHGSVRHTLVHMLSAEWGWLERCGGPPRGPKLDPDDYRNVESVVTTWNRVERDMRQFLSTQNDDTLAQSVEFSLGSGPKNSIPRGILLQHAAIHGVHHRGQVALLLRMLGHTPGDFDLVFYAGAAPLVAAAPAPRA